MRKVYLTIWHVMPRIICLAGYDFGSVFHFYFSQLAHPRVSISPHLIVSKDDCRASSYSINAGWMSKVTFHSWAHFISITIDYGMFNNILTATVFLKSAGVAKLIIGRLTFIDTIFHLLWVVNANLSRSHIVTGETFQPFKVESKYLPFEPFPTTCPFLTVWFGHQRAQQENQSKH